MTQDEILDSINTYGFIAIPEYAEDTSFIKKECENILKQEDESDYLFGKASRIGSFFDNRSTNPSISNFFGQNWMFQVLIEFGLLNICFT